jgi:hypothetical protein
MGASRSILENLLARVRQRAAEPRPSAVIPPLPVPRIDSPHLAKGAAAKARPAEDEIEEYEDELIEIIDDGEVSSEAPAPKVASIGPLKGVPPTLAPSKQVAPGAASFDGRRSSGPGARANEAPRPASAASAVASDTMRSEAVARRPLPAATQVIKRQGARPDLHDSSFVQLLDASLELGG